MAREHFFEVGPNGSYLVFIMEFSTNWFDVVKAPWSSVVAAHSPAKFLEIGSFEGASVCHFISLMGTKHALEIDCLDSWGGGQEHRGMDFHAIERRFEQNVREAIEQVSNPVQFRKLKSPSFEGLNFLLQEGKYNHYDCIYIDGSHETPDVLADAILAFRLLKVGGLIIFDDFLWGLGPDADPLMNPKLAIDSFMNCYQRKIQPLIGLPVYQLYCRKLAD